MKTALCVILACVLSGCVSQTITVNCGGSAYLNTTAEKPVTVAPKTTGVPAL